MKYLLSTIAVLATCLLLFSFVAVPIDDPETPYNESEAPTNLAIPVVVNSLAGVVNAGGPAAREQGMVWQIGTKQCATVAERRSGSLNSQLKLLRALRC